jgi:hypothetical protein
MRGALAAGTATALKEIRHAGVCVELRECTFLVEPARNRAFCEQVHSNDLGTGWSANPAVNTAH